jgi:hypothetical protein
MQACSLPSPVSGLPYRGGKPELPASQPARLPFRMLRGLDLNQRPLGYESVGSCRLVRLVPFCATPVRASYRRSPSCAAEVRVVRLHFVLAADQARVGARRFRSLAEIPALEATDLLRCAVAHVAGRPGRLAYQAAPRTRISSERRRTPLPSPRLDSRRPRRTNSGRGPHLTWEAREQCRPRSRAVAGHLVPGRRRSASGLWVHRRGGRRDP